jgi:hypothetical protein
MALLMQSSGWLKDEAVVSAIEAPAAEILTVAAHSIPQNLCGSRFVS